MIKQYNQYIYRDGQWLLVGASDQNNFVTYTLEKDGSTITLVGDDESTSDVVIKEFSDAASAKLNGIAAGAQVNVLEGVKVNGTTLTIDGNKLVDITVPTKLSDLTNDANYVSDASYVHTDNNYTTADKNKLGAIAAGADVNVIETVKVNNTALTPDGNKAVNITVPTKLTDLTNDNNFVTDNDYVHTDNNYTTNEKTKLGVTNIAFGTTSTQAATATKAVTIDGNANWSLQKGSIIVVKTTNTNTAQNPKLQIGSTTASSIWYDGALITTSNLDKAGNANRPAMYMFDGTNYIWLGWAFDQDTTYTNTKLGNGYAVSNTTGGNTAITATLSGYLLKTNGVVSVKFAEDVPANATLNVNNEGAKPIYYRGAAITVGIIKNGEIATFIYDGTNYHFISIDRIDDLSVYYTKTEVNTMVSAIPHFAISVVNALPTTDISDTTIYLVRASGSESQNLFTEYIYVNNAWEKLGEQRLDLSSYLTRAEASTLFTTSEDFKTINGESIVGSGDLSLQGYEVWDINIETLETAIRRGDITDGQLIRDEAHGISGYAVKSLTDLNSSLTWPEEDSGIILINLIESFDVGNIPFYSVVCSYMKTEIEIDNTAHDVLTITGTAKGDGIEVPIYSECNITIIQTDPSLSSVDDCLIQIIYNTARSSSSINTEGGNYTNSWQIGGNS